MPMQKFFSLFSSTLVMSVLEPPMQRTENKVNTATKAAAL